MACSKCVINPKSHCFIQFGNIAEKHLYYTAPAKATELVKSEADFKYLKIHLDLVKPPWIWVLDCTGMTLKHYTNIGLIKKLINLIEKEQLDILKEIWIIFPNIWIRGIIKALKGCIKSELLQRVKLYDGNKLDVFMKVEKAGLTKESFTSLHNIVNQLP